MYQEAWRQREGREEEENFGPGKGDQGGGERDTHEEGGLQREVP